jgi:hypothetical protein
MASGCLALCCGEASTKPGTQPFRVRGNCRTAAHLLSGVLLLPWIDVFVTNDDGLAKRTRRALARAFLLRTVRIRSPRQNATACDGGRIVA